MDSRHVTGITDDFSIVKPLSIGVKKRVNNSKVGPQFSIEKIDKNDFELEFLIKKNENQDLKVSLVPINCDHMLLWLFESINDGVPSFFGMISEVDNNNGMWIIKTLNNKYNEEFSIVSDTNPNMLQNIVSKHTFSLKFNTLEDRKFRLLVSKI